MSIGSVGAAGAGHLQQLMATMLSRLEVSNDDTASTSATAMPLAGTPGDADACKKPTFSTAALSDKIVSLLVGMQAHEEGAGDSSDGLVDRAFQAIDTDGDGSLSKSEVEAGIEQLGRTQAQADKFFAGLGGDDTTGISKDDFASAAKEGRTARAHGGFYGGPVKIFDLVDSNKDWTLSADEVATAFPKAEADGTSAPSLFETLDADADGTVTGEEFSALLKSFRDSAARSYGASDALLAMPPAGAKKSVDA